MESLDQPGQNYYEGTLLPLDPTMHQNKRDSAYSSFSASSNISDYTVSARMDVSSPINCFLGANKQEDGRYLQTGQGAVDSQVDTSRQSLNEHFEKASIISYDAHNLDNINSPPQPPIRRDSLRENKNQFCNGDRRASAPGDSFRMSGMWKSEASQFNSAENAFCQCTNGPCTVHLPENLSSDQYYMLTSESDKVHQSGKYAKDDERQLNHCKESKIKWSEDDRETKVFNCNNTGETPCNIKRIVTETVKNSDCEQWKALCHHSTQRNMSSVQANFRTDLHSTSSTDCHYSTDECKEENEKRYECNANKDFETSQNQSTEQPSDKSVLHLYSSKDRSVKMPNEAKDAPSSPSNNYVDGLNSSCITATVIEDASGREESVGQIKKPGSSRHRSAQMRRRSDRFATNLRNEIQKRKAQLQKSKDSKVLLSGEESVEEKDEAVETHSELISPPPPPPKNKALILEIKRANAEKFRSSKDYLNQGKQRGDLTDKTNETHNHSIKENIPSEKEAFIEHEGLLLPSQNQTYNEWWKSNTPDTRHQESLLQSRNQIDHANTEQKCSYFIEDFQQAMYMAPKPESFMNEWAQFPTSKPNSPDMWKTEDEISRGRMKIPVECRDSLGLEQTPSTEVCGANILENACDNQPPTEPLDKHINVNNACHMNNHGFHSERKWNSMQCTSEQPVTERKIMYQPNSEQKKKVHDVRKSDDFSSAAQIKSPQEFSEIKNDISQHNPNGGAKRIWSPEHKLQTPYIEREIGQKLNGMNMKETVPPITKMSDENVLLPFADRRKFFEDVSKGPTPSFAVNEKSNKDFCPSITDNLLSQTVGPDLRRHSVDHTHYTTSPRRQESGLPHCNPCMNHIVDPPMCCNHGQHSDYLPLLTYGYRACVFCANDLCPALRNMPVAHHSYHCQHLHPHHHHPWTKCADYFCPAQCNLLEEGGSLHVDQWHMRKPLSQVRTNLMYVSALMSLFIYSILI